jgi:hypothetical protein
MGVTNFPNGVSSFGMPMLGTHMTTGAVYFVDDSGSNSNSGKDADNPFADLDYAIGMCSASKSDTIFLMPGHAETATAIAADVAGINIIGLGRGGNMPTITSTVAATDLINVTAANVYIENIKLVGAASCTAFIDIAAADFMANNVQMFGVATPENYVTITAAGQRFQLENCLFDGSTDGPNNGIIIEANGLTGGWRVKDCVFNFHDVGLDEAGIVAAFDIPGGVIDGCTFIGMDLTAVDFGSSVQSTQCEGIVTNCAIAAGATANTLTLLDLAGYGAVECYGTDVGTESGALIPSTTPA